MTVRNKVLWAGKSPQPDVVEECSNRGLMLEHLVQGDIGAPVLALSRGIVYKFSPSTLTMTRELFLQNPGFCHQSRARFVLNCRQ